jgi:hypothetical protein
MTRYLCGFAVAHALKHWRYDDQFKNTSGVFQKNGLCPSAAKLPN